MIEPCVVCPAWHVCDFVVTHDYDTGMIDAIKRYRVRISDGVPLCVHPYKIGLHEGQHRGLRLTEHRGRVKIISV